VELDNMAQISDIMREGVVVIIKITGPMLLLSMVVGILVAIFQAVTQIHEQSLQFVLKLLVVITLLLISGGWMMTNLTDYAQRLFTLMATG